MSRLPDHARRRSHAELFAELSAAARARFAGPPRGLWDPERDEAAADPGRAVLDAFALALHVLWTYQEAWAEEGFLATAQLDASIDRLLAGAGYRRSPGSAAVGLQHFRCRAGMRATLPVGFAVRSPPRGDEPEAVFETLDVLRLDPDLNEVRALWPADAGAGAPAASAAFEVVPPLPGDRPASLADSLFDALQGERAGQAAVRAAARARQKALRYGDMLGLVQEAADRDPTIDLAALRSALEPVCKLLCEAQRDAAKAAPLASADPPSESQEILARQLRQLQKRSPAAASDLDRAMARSPGESDAAYAARLAAMARFLDTFVAALVQDARDQVVLLHGVDALHRLDRAAAGGDSPLGRAKKGQDRLYVGAPAGAGQLRALPAVRPGDWFVIGEDLERVDPRGQTTGERVYRQAIRVLRVGEGRPAPSLPPLTLIQFEPPLARDHDLGRTVLLGNVAPISEGATVEERPQPSADRLLVPLSRGPLTWLRDPSAAFGRRPEVRLSVGERPWRRVGSLLDPTAGPACYAVEPTPEGGVVLRVGDGLVGAALPDAPVTVRYRVGLGARGNRAALRIDAPATAHPAVEQTLNPLPTAGGTDPEQRAHARVRGPRVLAATDRAVSIADVQALARAFDGVLRARAFLQGTARRAQCVVVVAGPAGAPLVADDREALRRHLAARVPPGVRVAVENRVFVPLRAAITLRTERGADPAAIFRAVRLRLGVDRDDAAPPGLLDPDNVDLDDDLRLSSLYGALAGTPGLVSAVVQALHRDGEPAVLHDRVEVGPRELLGWARPTDGSEGVALAHEEVRQP